MKAVFLTLGIIAFGAGSFYAGQHFRPNPAAKPITSRKIPGLPDFTEAVKLLTVPFTAEDYIIMLGRHESLVEQAWVQALEPIRAGQQEFTVTVLDSAEDHPQTRISFYRLNPANDAPPNQGSYQVVGAIAGIFTFLFDSKTFEKVDFVAGIIGTSAPAPQDTMLHLRHYSTLPPASPMK